MIVPKREKKKPRNQTKFDKFKKVFVQYSPYIVAELSLPLCFVFGMSIPNITDSFIIMGLLVIPGMFIPYFVFQSVKYIIWG